MPMMIPPENMINAMYGKQWATKEVPAIVAKSDVDCLLGEGWQVVDENEEPKKEEIEEIDLDEDKEI